jgi:hypothetical protein
MPTQSLGGVRIGGAVGSLRHVRQRSTGGSRRRDSVLHSAYVSFVFREWDREPRIRHSRECRRSLLTLDHHVRATVGGELL